MPVATPSTTSNAGPAWRSGRRLSRQKARAVVSRLPRVASRSPARAAAGSSRTPATVPPASAAAGATTSTGSTPSPPLTDGATAEYRRNCQTARAASPMRATSAPPCAAREIAAGLPRRARARPGERGRSAGASMMTTASPATTAAACHAPPVMPETRSPAVRNGPFRDTSRARAVPATSPAAAAPTASGTISATLMLATCQRAPPRAVNSASSPLAGWSAAAPRRRVRRQPAAESAAHRWPAATGPPPGRWRRRGICRAGP